jgi:hypothetical protein
MRILGIDPGINGACSLYCSESTVPTVPNGMFDIPTLGDSKQREVDYGGLCDLIWQLKPDVAVIEIVNAFMPAPAEGEESVRWGGTSLFRFGGAYYAIHAVVACLKIPRHRVASPSWKNHFGLKGKKKGGGIDDSARQVVLRRFPAVHPFLKIKGNQHRAEAFLMAVWYAETGGRSAKRSKKKSEDMDFGDDTASAKRARSERWRDAEDIPD